MAGEEFLGNDDPLKAGGYNFDLTLPWGTLPWGTLPWGTLPWGTLPLGTLPWGTLPWRTMPKSPGDGNRTLQFFWVLMKIHMMLKPTKRC